MKRTTLFQSFLINHVNIRSLLIIFPLALSFPGLVFAESWPVSKYSKEIGPLNVGDKVFEIVVNLQKIEPPSVAFDKTVESFEIKDAQGRIYYHRKFPVHLNKNGFSEAFAIRGYAIEGENGRGVILYYSIEPSAPSGGRFCQILALKQGRLVPLSPPLTCYGKIAALPQDPSSHSRRLFAGDVIKVSIWTGQFGVIVPLAVDWKELSIKPIVAKGKFKIKAEKQPPQEGQVQLFSQPDHLSGSKHIKIKKDSHIKLIKAYAEVVMDTFHSPFSEIHINLQNPWLNISVDGTAGWINNWRALQSIGLPSAG